ncbi:MAG TPA: hypothetical protein VGA34_13095, partial [Alteraurantiacibacter sp.]
MLKAKLAGLAAAAMVGSILAGCASMEASTPEASAPQDIAINGSMVFPESITHDAAGNLYNGSVPGVIYRTRPGSRT